MIALHQKLVHVETSSSSTEGSRKLHSVTISDKKFQVPKTYQPKALIGTGNSGVVASATSTIHSDNVAIKKMSNIFVDSMTCKRAIREVKLLKQLNHSNIISVTDLFMNEVC